MNNSGKTALGLDAKVGAGLCYVANLIPCFVPLGLIYSILVVVQDKENKLTRFHAFQSILWTVAGLVIIIPLYIVMIVGLVVDSQIGFPVISGIVGLGLLVFCLALLFFLVMAVINAFQGQIYKVPVIGNMADKWSN